MLSRYKDSFEGVLRVLSSPFTRFNVNPNVLTLSGLVLALAYLLAVEVRAGPLVTVTLYALSLLMDGVDGVVARSSGRNTRFGAFLDSTVDRLVDVIYLFSLYRLSVTGVEGLILAVTGSLLISYTRARAEGLGLSLAGVGLMERSERGIVILFILVLSYYHLGIATALFYILLSLIYITLIQRIVRTYQGLKGEEA